MIGKLKFIGLLAFLFLQSCENKWPTKATSKKLDGKWTLESARFSNFSGGDTTIQNVAGYVNFPLYKRGVGELNYSLVAGTAVKTTFTLVDSERIFIQSCNCETDIDLYSMHEIVKLSERELTTAGRCYLADGESWMVNLHFVK